MLAKFLLGCRFNICGKINAGFCLKLCFVHDLAMQTNAKQNCSHFMKMFMKKFCPQNVVDEKYHPLLVINTHSDSDVNKYLAQTSIINRYQHSD